MSRYEYYLVEGTYLVRLTTRTAEFVKPDGTWHAYPDRHDVESNGRFLCADEATALEEAKKLFEKLAGYGFEYD